jgi:hypothetical protein
MISQEQKNIKVGDLVRFKHNIGSKVYIVMSETSTGWYVQLSGLHHSQVVSRENLEVVSVR